MGSINELEQIVGTSVTQKNTVAIFKHSTRCALSSMVKSRLEKSWDKYNNDLPIYLLNLIKHRDLSNLIASQFKVEHQSPQLILINSGNVVYSASHGSICAGDVAKYN